MYDSNIVPQSFFLPISPQPLLGSTGSTSQIRTRARATPTLTPITGSNTGFQVHSLKLQPAISQLKRRSLQWLFTIKLLRMKAHLLGKKTPDACSDTLTHIFLLLLNDYRSHPSPFTLFLLSLGEISSDESQELPHGIHASCQLTPFHQSKQSVPQVTSTGGLETQRKV